MRSNNMHVIIGNLGRDVEIVEFSNGGKIARFPVATNADYFDSDKGEWVKKTDWHMVVMKVPKLIDARADKLLKGVQVQILGKVETRSYKDQNGNDRYVTETIVARNGNVLVLDRPSRESSQAGQEATAPHASQNANSEVFDDEIPF